MNDQFDLEVDGDPASVAAWVQAYEEYLDYSGDPIATLSAASAADDGFALGPAFCAAYRMLAGLSPALAEVAADLERCVQRARSPRERVFAGAVSAIASGEFASAAAVLGAWTEQEPSDLPAWKLAHDLYLHNGDGLGRLRSAGAAAAATVFAPGSRDHGVAAGHLAFALEEVGRYSDAERWGELAMTINPGDAWGRHALAHVYESQARHDAMVGLLVDGLAHWQDRTLFTNHLWWHLAVRLLNEGDVDGAQEVLDTRLASATPFGLCDTTSLVWRLELVGVDVAEHWQAMARRWADARHLFDSGFVNVHAAYALAAAEATAAESTATEATGDSDHDGCGDVDQDDGRGDEIGRIGTWFRAATNSAPTGPFPRWSAAPDAWSNPLPADADGRADDLGGARDMSGAPDGRPSAGLGATSTGLAELPENAATFERVVRPLGDAFRMLRGGRSGGCAVAIRSVLPDLHHLGGSVIQRQVIVETMHAIEQQGFRG